MPTDFLKIPFWKRVVIVLGMIIFSAPSALHLIDNYIRDLSTGRAWAVLSLTGILHFTKHLSKWYIKDNQHPNLICIANLLVAGAAGGIHVWSVREIASSSSSDSSDSSATENTDDIKKTSDENNTSIVNDTAQTNDTTNANKTIETGITTDNEEEILEGEIIVEVNGIINEGEGETIAGNDEEEIIEENTFEGNSTSNANNTENSGGYENKTATDGTEAEKVEVEAETETETVPEKKGDTGNHIAVLILNIVCLIYHLVEVFTTSEGGAPVQYVAAPTQERPPPAIEMPRYYYG